MLESCYSIGLQSAALHPRLALMCGQGNQAVTAPSELSDYLRIWSLGGGQSLMPRSLSLPACKNMTKFFKSLPV